MKELRIKAMVLPLFLDAKQKPSLGRRQHFE